MIDTKDRHVRRAALMPRRRKFTLVAVTGTLLIPSAASAASSRATESTSLCTRESPPQETAPRTSADPTFDHSALDALLKKHVDAKGWVDYAALHKDSRQLDAYVASLAEAPYDKLDRNEKLVLLINAYNACTLRLILDHWPVKSIMDIPEAKRWKHKRWRIGDLTLSLDEIENAYLRPKFREPRIHFAVNCASIGCPPLRPEAYSVARIDEQLQQQAAIVHADKRWFRLDAGVVHLCKLYEWYADDFKQDGGSVLQYAAKFSPALKQALKKNPSLQVRWVEWDWALNVKRVQP